MCRSIFCCLDCRNRHEQNSHCPNEVWTERNRLRCGLCQGLPMLEFCNRNDFALIMHLCQSHLPLHCRKCLTVITPLIRFFRTLLLLRFFRLSFSMVFLFFSFHFVFCCHHLSYYSNLIRLETFRLRINVLILMMFAVCNHRCSPHLISTVMHIAAVTVTITAPIKVKIIQRQAQKMCLTQITLLLSRNHHSNVAYATTVLYRCGIIRPFCIHRIIHCTKRKHPWWQRHWCVKHPHLCIIIWRLPTPHRQRYRCNRYTQTDHLAANAWEHRHRLDSYHVSTAAVTVTQALVLLLSPMIFGKFQACVSVPLFTFTKSTFFIQCMLPKYFHLKQAKYSTAKHCDDNEQNNFCDGGRCCCRGI